MSISIRPHASPLDVRTHVRSGGLGLSVRFGSEEVGAVTAVYRSKCYLRHLDMFIHRQHMTSYTSFWELCTAPALLCNTAAASDCAALRHHNVWGDGRSVRRLKPTTTSHGCSSKPQPCSSSIVWLCSQRVGSWSSLHIRQPSLVKEFCQKLSRLFTAVLSTLARQ